MSSSTISYRQLAKILLTNGEDVEECLKVIQENNPKAIPAEKKQRIRRFLIKTFLPRLMKELEIADSHTDRSYEDENWWLNGEYSLDRLAAPIPPEDKNEDTLRGTAKKPRGRPHKAFEDCTSGTQEVKRKMLLRKIALEPTEEQ